MATDRFCLKIEIMPDGLRLRYMQVFSGSIMDMVSLPVGRYSQAVHVTCQKHPGDTRLDISKAEAAQLIREWRKEALEVVLVDHRKAIQEVMLPNGVVLKRDSNLLLMVVAFRHWQQGEMLLAEDDAQALKVWIGDRVPFGMDAVESIKDMQALDRLEDV